MALIVCDSEGGKQFRMFLFKLVLLKVEREVFIKGPCQHHVYILDVFGGNRVDRGIFMHAINAGLLVVCYCLKVGSFFDVVVLDEEMGGDNEDALPDKLSKVLRDQ